MWRSEYTVSLLLSLVTLVTVLSCSSSGTESSDISISGSPLDLGPDFTLPVCLASIEANSPQDIYDLIPAQWPYYCEVMSSAVPVSPDIVITNPVVLDVADIPEVTLTGNPYIPSPPLVGLFFKVSPALGGVEVIETDPANPSAVPTVVRLGPGRYRIRPAAKILLPIGGHSAWIEILPPCGHPCGDDEVECPLDGVCWPLDLNESGQFYTYCAGCLQRSRDECICWIRGGPLPDGTFCLRKVQGECSDYLMSGSCLAGRCGEPIDDK